MLYNTLENYNAVTAKFDDNANLEEHCKVLQVKINQLEQDLEKASHDLENKTKIVENLESALEFLKNEKALETQKWVSEKQGLAFVYQF